jgi:enamine deaminase RidA (YjgF/YER057c/UK114 family)
MPLRGPRAPRLPPPKSAGIDGVSYVLSVLAAPASALYKDFRLQTAHTSLQLIEEDCVTIQRFETGARLSRVVVHGDTVYLAGLTADKAAGQSVGAQTQEILSAIDGLLAKAGTDKSKLVQATIWLQDIRTVDEMNKVWDAWMPQGCAPARACIEARLQSPAKMVEIRVTAAK